MLASAQGPANPLSTPTPPRVILIGFVGGLVVHNNDTRHPEVQIIHHFQENPVPGVDAEVFENGKRNLAQQRILQLLDANKDGALSADEKQRAQIILFGYSFGGSAVTKLAEELERQDIPVMLTIQVDSVGKFEPKSCVVPANVRQAVNLYQTGLPIRGCQTFRAADPTHTKILENIRIQDHGEPPECRAFPWWDRWFFRPHNALGCDPNVWSEVEKQINAALETNAISSSSEQKSNGSLPTNEGDKHR